MRLLVFNIAGIALLLAAAGEGWVWQAATAGGPIMWPIAATFALGLWQTWRAHRTGDVTRLRILRQISDALVMLGLIGTVLGFIVALAGVDPQSAGDVSRVTDMVAQLVHGMGIALYTTLAGAIFALWLTVNRQLLMLRHD